MVTQTNAGPVADGVLLRRLVTRKKVVHLAVAAIISVALGHFMDSVKELRPLRFLAYQVLSAIEWDSPAENLLIVKISDDDYYTVGGPEIPVSIQLSRLLPKIAAYNPKAIAVDIELMVPPESEARARNLLTTIGAEKSKTVFVFPDTVSERIVRSAAGKESTQFERPEDSLQAFAEKLPTSVTGNIRFGHIRILEDVRRLSIALPIQGTRGEELAPSFAAEAVGWQDPQTEHRAETEGLFPYAAFWRSSDFRSVRSADFNEPGSKAVLHGMISPDTVVLVAGAFHSEGLGLGVLADSEFPSPVGDLPGYQLQANYISSLLNRKWLYLEMPEWLLLVIEVFVVALIAIVRDAILAIKITRHMRPLMSVVFVTFVMFIAVASINIILRRFNFYFDVAIPSLLILLHCFVDDYAEASSDPGRWLSHEHPAHDAHELVGKMLDQFRVNFDHLARRLKKNKRETRLLVRAIVLQRMCLMDQEDIRFLARVNTDLAFRIFVGFRMYESVWDLQHFRENKEIIYSEIGESVVQQIADTVAADRSFATA